MAQAVSQRFGDTGRVAFPLSATIHSKRFRGTHPTALISDYPSETWKKAAFNRVTQTAERAARLLPHGFRRSLNVVTDGEIDVVFDLSGYCYGDYWGEGRIVDTTKRYRAWADRGKEIVFMPKTWGPFAKIKAARVNALFDCVSLAFARDERSLEILRATLSSQNQEKVHFAPDYTHSVQPAKSPVDTSQSYLVIPSYRVIDSGTCTREQYVAFLAHARQRLDKAGGNPLLVLHEVSRDRWFRSVSASMGFSDEAVIVIDDERELKAAVGMSRGVVTSRLHGLYNALNLEVPVLVAAWNFKYEEALRHYGCEGCLLERPDLITSFDAKLDILIEPHCRAAVQAAMSQHRHVIEAQTREMWDLIESVIKRRAGTARHLNGTE